MKKQSRFRFFILLSSFFIIAVIYIKQSSEIYFQKELKRLQQRRIPKSTNLLSEDIPASFPEKITIVINPVSELDFKIKQDIFKMRKRFVDQSAELVKGDYEPFSGTFGRIVDGKPWWGLEGQFCKTAGRNSIDGPSEETRFFNNPFLLLGLNSNEFVYQKGRFCFAVYPHPGSFQWYARQRRAVVTYDMKKYLQERARIKTRRDDDHSFSLTNYNARDFGLEYVYADPKQCKNVRPTRRSRIFKEPVKLQGFIHLGGSCGYPGGCNNESPFEPFLGFFIHGLPAQLTCKLWRDLPSNQSQDPDFEFILEFQ